MSRITACLCSILFLSVTVISAQYANCNFICNTDFEDEKLVQNGQFGFFDQDRVSCWNTTATDRMIEIWGSGFGGVPAYSGNQFAELNANMVSTLYQNFNAAHSGTVEISFAHRGRAGVDQLSVEIGPANGPYTNLGTFSAGNSSWVFNTITYTFPDTGRIDFVIRFNSVSAAGGATVGNFLDAITIKLPPPQADFFITKPSCPGQSNGSILLNSIKGSLPFTYLWNTPLNSTDSMLFNLSTGNYEVEITDFYGCKINYAFQLDAAYHNDTTEISDTVCNNYTWPITGETFTNSGTYSTILQNRVGCDSIINLQLTIQKIDSSFLSVSTCNSYTWPINNQKYVQDGLYAHTLTNIHNCDSIIFLDLKVLSSQTHIDTVQICNSYTWPTNGQTYKQGGVYSDTLTNIHGCDSILVLDLKILPGQRFINTVKICDSYTWPANNQIYYQSGIYMDSLKTVDGCDSILILDLEILYSQYFKDSVGICDSYTWPANGQTYNQSGTYNAIFQNSFGCDSTWVLKLTILESTASEKTISACDNYTFDLNGVTYTQSGSYTFLTRNANGCDSIFTLHLQINPGYQKEDTIIQCKDFIWPVSGKRYTQGGDYKLNLQSAKGCDSIHLLHLIVEPDYVFNDTVIAVEKYLWLVNDELYKESGIYQTIYKTNQGCDSIHVLVLKIIRRGQIYIPNVFSPNGDGINDKFIVYSSPEILVIDRLRIFDRWGELLFEEYDLAPNDPRYGWDGNFNLQHLNPGVFVYTVEWTDLEGEKHFEQGDVTLIR